MGLKENIQELEKRIAEFCKARSKRPNMENYYLWPNNTESWIVIGVTLVSASFLSGLLLGSDLSPKSPEPLSFEGPLENEDEVIMLDVDCQPSHDVIKVSHTFIYDCEWSKNDTFASLDEEIGNLMTLEQFNDRTDNRTRPPRYAISAGQKNGSFEILGSDIPGRYYYIMDSNQEELEKHDEYISTREFRRFSGDFYVRSEDYVRDWQYRRVTIGFQLLVLVTIVIGGLQLNLQLNKLHLEEN